MLDIAREKRKKLKKQREKGKIRKSQTVIINIILLLLFHIEKFIFCQKTFLRKLNLHCYICIIVFPRGRLLEM